MTQYRAPVAEIVRAMEVAGIDELLATPRFSSLDKSSLREVLGGFGRLATDVIAPTDRAGDRVGARLDPVTGAVAVPPELGAAFAAYVAGGWVGLAAPEDAGGAGFPTVAGLALQEMFGSANLSLSLNPLLTNSAMELLERWGDERQRKLYLSRMVSGECSGTMMLTEPDSGSDLSTVRTRAVPAANGRWLLSGTKIFITWGQHDLVRNIFHLVLARTPDAPAGIKGISLFLVPRDLEDETGRVVGPNAVRCVGLEHKLGIHASPTCVMQLDGAEGELVGPLHGGMAAMFSMMNAARLAVGLQGVSIAEIALQQAAAFTRERRQGRRPGSAGPALLVEHPDVQRMLVDIAATLDASRLVCYATAIATDLAEHAADEQQRAAARRRVELLTPIAKAWPTDQGVRVASVALQVHGGMGFVEETGIAQRYRDARIAPIYEGTNGIQSIDLVQRKVARDRGAAARELLDDITAEITLAAGSPALARAAGILDAAVSDAREATAWVVASEADRTDDVLAGATEYLELLALCVASGLLLRRARLDLAAVTGTASRSTARCEFFALHHVARRPTAATIRGGTSLAAALPD